MGVSPLIASSSRRLTSQQVSERETAFQSLVYCTYSSYFNTMRAASSRPYCLARAAFAVAGVMHAACVTRSLLLRSPRKQTRPSEPNNGTRNRTCSPWTTLQLRSGPTRHAISLLLSPESPAVCLPGRATRRTCREENAFALPYMVRKRGRSFRIH